jgi:DNA transformation protein
LPAYSRPVEEYPKLTHHLGYYDAGLVYSLFQSYNARLQADMMKRTSEYLEYVMEKLNPLGQIKSRAMFGGYGIFHEGVMFALIADDNLYFKVNESNRDDYRKAGSQPFPHGMSYWEVPYEVLEDNSELPIWAESSIAIAHDLARKKRR